MGGADQARPDQAWPLLRMAVERAMDERPEDPAGVAIVMRRVEGLLLDIADLLARLNAARYDAEVTYTSVRNQAMAKAAGEGHSVTIARALGEEKAVPERRAWDAQRVLFHYAEDTQRALAAKHYGLMNTQRSLSSVLYEAGRR
ncbi:MAG: hypothetical protein LBG60_10810 [Bifidobacteriaceae bacterium]|jgi:hypothetical protein|nr:hypothetical protein [Bifidobacteriaceae bacterium]